jgi:exodeoxyribonuclease V alpha subunit
MPEDMKANCVTIHKLLQYEPIYPEVWDEATQKMKTTMKFVPARNADNPLPTSIKTIIIEEASMPSVELFNKILDALSHPVQFIFLGDIQQLPPVFGQAILGFKMLELPVVELTEVYRQALESPIIRKAQRIISGVPIPPEELPSWNTPGKLRIIPWEKKINSDNALLTLAKFFTTQIEKGNYDPQEDMILIPYNKACGTIELNKHIANFLARRRHAKTYEVIAGFQKHYFSIGDTILYDKEDAEIVDIYQNPKYAGKPPQKESLTLDYWGQEHSASAGKDENWFEGVDIDQLLLAASDKEDRVNQASHVIKIKLTNSEKEVLIDKAGDVNLVLLGYALTVHKAQGSEWRKVFFCSHQTHSKMLQRELVYTAITRAREQLIIICEPNLFVGGIISQRYPGNTWQEKAEYFKGKLETLSENEK